MFDGHQAGGQTAGREHDIWESNVELDLVAPDPDDAKRLLVAEVKWRRLTAAERKNVLRQLESKWSHCSLRARHQRVRFDVLDASVLDA
jgi:hypothetical protein